MSIHETQISYYENYKKIDSSLTITIGDFLEAIRNGTYKKQIDKVRAESDKDKRNDLKRSVLECFTISGVFKKRNNAALLAHSGLIALDIDDVSDARQVREQIANDPHILAVMLSASGNGVCAIARIETVKNNEDQHEIWYGLDTYFNEKYGLNIDSACKDVARLRFASYDPEIIIKDDAKQFKTPAKRKPKEYKNAPRIIATNDDYEHVVQQIESKRVNLVESYQEWRDMAWALMDELGAGGLDYFHRISRQSSKYDPQTTDQYWALFYKSYDASRSRAKSRRHFFHASKEAGLDIVSPKTKLIASKVRTMYHQNAQKSSVIAQVSQDEQIPVEDVERVVEAIYEANGDVETGETVEEEVASVLRTLGDFRFNDITKKVEYNGYPIDDYACNTVYLKAASMVRRRFSFDTMFRIINSEFSASYNPIQDFFAKSPTKYKRTEIKAIREVAESLMVADEDREWTTSSIMLWLVAMVESLITDKPNPYMLILVGEQQGTGKTTFFRKLLPERFKPYYADASLSGSKDDMISTTEKMLILVDEMAGLHSADWNLIKQMLTQVEVDVRPPYGRFTIKRNRIASWAGTSNKMDLLPDKTGNRRFIPIRIEGIDRERFNAVDKEEMLYEAYWFVKQGYSGDLTTNYYNMITQRADDFRLPSVEEDLICTHLSNTPTEYMTCSEIIQYLTTSTNHTLKLSPKTLGSELKKSNFTRISKRINGKPTVVYAITRLK